MRKIYLLMLSSVLCSSVAMAQKFVTESGAGSKDGSNWANAYDASQLQAAINAADAETDPTQKQVWVAKGTYKPTESLSSTGFLTDGSTPVTDRDKAFILKTAVEIYGGFVGTESAIGDRINIATTNETILSGDLNNNNTADDGDYYHVISSRDYCKGAILDGFTIQHGFANGAGGITENGIEIVQNNGGGIAIRGTYTEATFRNLIIKNCIATNYGGGMWTRGSGTADGYVFENVTFQNNTALRGGGVYVDISGGTHKAQFSNCQFLNNTGTGATSGDGGGAMLCANGTTTRTVSISNSLFKGNTTSAYGGAIRVNDATTVNLTNVNFEDGDAAARGGAIYSTGTSIVNINGCNFKSNNVSSGVGGHYYLFSGTVNITNNSVFEKGTATTTGGAIYINGGSLVVASSTFKENKSTTSGGAFYMNNGSLVITSSTFKENKSTASGGVFYIYAGTVNISKSVFTSNEATSAAGVLYNLTGTVDIQKSQFYSNIANTSGGVFYINTGENNPSTTTVSNSVFYNNISKTTSTGAAGGGVIYQTYQTGVISTVTMINNIFYANKAANENGCYSFNSNANVKINLYNNIFDGNVANYTTTPSTTASADIRRLTGATQTIKNNIFQSTLATGTSGNRVVANPYVLGGGDVIFASINPADVNFLYPASNSFAKDKGDNNLVPRIYSNDDPPVDITETAATDLLGNPRFVGAVDLGSIEWSTVLPVKVGSFTANLVNNRTQLKWSVGTEDNVNRYEVERSQNGVDFTKVTEVKANGSASYQTTDNNPQVGDNYYRLVIVDNDGSRSQYGALAIVKVASLAAQNIQIYPNPVKGNEVKVSLGNVAAGAYSYKVVSAQGSVVQQGTLNYNGSLAVINLSAVANGVYVLHFSNGTQTKLVKQ